MDGKPNSKDRLMIKRSRSLILAIGMLLAACAAPGPMTLTCSEAGLTAAELEKTVHLADFSVDAPEGKRWCLAYKTPTSVTFYTHPLMGQFIEKPERSMFPSTNTFFLRAEIVRHNAADLNGAAALHQFIEEWLKRGGGVNRSGTEVTLVSTNDPRFTLISSEMDPEPSLDADCVGYRALVEERDNPKYPGVVLNTRDHAMICLITKSPDYVVIMVWSERYEPGNQADPEYFDRIENEDVERFFKSLKITN
jgi:hypothetical protein